MTNVRRGEDMIALWRSERTKWPWSHPFFALAPAQTNSVAFSVNAINKRFGIWCWLVLSIASFFSFFFFYHNAEFSLKGWMSCPWLTYLNKSLHPLSRTPISGKCVWAGLGQSVHAFLPEWLFHEPLFCRSCWWF